MTNERRLTLKRERLAELSSTELRDVVGAEASGAACVTDNGACKISDVVMSLCGCFTGYCSIDVC